MTDPLVSVVMPVRNPHPVYFRQAVQSVLDQTLDDFELIIIERPYGRQAADDLAAVDDSRVRHVIAADCRDVIDQRNQALGAARAELLAFLDADDIAEPNRLEKQCACLLADPRLDVLGSQVRIIDGDGSELGFRAFPLEHDAIVSTMRSYNAICQPSTMVRRAAVLSAGGYSYRRHPAEDYELWCRLARHGARFANHPEPLTRYRYHPGQSKSTALRATLRGTLEVKKMYWRGQMTWPEAARMWGERLLLYLPPRLVLALFKRFYYRARLRAQEPLLPACANPSPMQNVP
jgi:glycosyltransferase involved in cell wall biosynthesis